MNELKQFNHDEYGTIFQNTIEDMERVGTYKAEFTPAITRYCEMRVQFGILMAQWYANGCKITEKYTNKAGFTNNRKTTLYQSIETLRKEILDLENLFGLTPAGLKKIKTDGLKAPKESKLAKALSKLD